MARHQVSATFPRPEPFKASGSSVAEWLPAICVRAWTTGHIRDDTDVLLFHSGKEQADGKLKT